MVNNTWIVSFVFLISAQEIEHCVISIILLI